MCNSIECQGPIPAKAGEPDKHQASRHLARAYPREGGGTMHMQRRGIIVTGLSPRRRGNLLPVIHDWLLGGPIPAKAGEPSLKKRLAGFRGAYPREGGGTIHSEAADAFRQGRSPRRRGNQPGQGRLYSYDGPIPAKAGEPSQQHGQFGLDWAYPREGGGTMWLEYVASESWGLSPRRRGNPKKPVIANFFYGPIPAKAGEPCVFWAPSRKRRAYPREGGGTEQRGQFFCIHGGLSPRRRGNPAVRDCRH